jgi:hypothetical protein
VHGALTLLGWDAVVPASSRVQSIVVLEGLLLANSSHGAMGKLRTALCKSRGNGVPTLTLGIGRAPLPISAASIIDADTAWFTYLLVASAIVRLGLQCVQTKNRPETREFVFALMHEVRLQSLLLHVHGSGAARAEAPRASQRSEEQPREGAKRAKHDDGAAGDLPPPSAAKRPRTELDRPGAFDKPSGLAPVSPYEEIAILD